MGRSSFPTELDTDLEIPRVEGNVTEIGGDAINALRDAIFSIEGAIGISPAGNKPSLADRVSVSIDSDGKIKSSALSGIGLVTLPIDNSHIAVAANIAESKLNLDFSTITLNNSINSLTTTVSAVSDAITSTNIDFLEHVTGIADRHDGYEVDLRSPVQTANDVESAIHIVDTVNVIQSKSISSIQSSITSIEGSITALGSPANDLIDSQDRLHLSSVAMNKRAEQGDQGNLINTTLASTIFQTNTAATTNILQVMRPNVARVTGKVPLLSSLTIGSVDNLSIQAGGLGRTTLDVDLSSIIPTGDLDDIAETINIAAHSASNHYPISAYNVDGRLTIAHSIPGLPHTISIESIADSAATALGFGSVTGTTFSTSDVNNHTAYVGGKKIFDVKSLLDIGYDHSGINLDEINPNMGDLNSLFGVASDSEGRLICNITNHSTSAAANGSYYIVSIDGTSNESFTINTNLAAGTFNIEVAADSVNFESSSVGQLYDIFLDPVSEDGYDGYGLVTKSLRVEYLTIPNIHIKSVNSTFPTTGTIQWSVIANNSLKLIHNGDSGVSVTIPSGYRGELRAFMPDNVNSALFQVTGNTSTSSTQNISTVNAFAGTDDKIHISSVHHRGNFGNNILKFPEDKRILGNSPVTQYKDDLEPADLNDAFGELRNNGVIRGFDVISNTTTTIKVRGGRILIGGVLVNIETKDVVIDPATLSGGTNRLLTLDKDGIYQILNLAFINEFENNDAYGDVRGIVPVVEFGVTDSALNGTFTDKRLMVDNLDKRVDSAVSVINGRIDNLVSASSNMIGTTETFSTDAYGEFIASIYIGSNPGFTAIDDTGFTSGTSIDRRFEFTDSGTIQKSIFKSVGMTHITIMAQAEYLGSNANAAFGTSGAVEIQLGAEVTSGIGNDGYEEEYVTVKSITSSILPTVVTTEQYVVSIPLSLLDIDDNTVFDIDTRVKIINAENVDGTNGSIAPLLRFGKVRVITSTYSVAGSILGQDGATTALAAVVGDTL